ncbi:unnamed protein product [Closterium sp. NIES-65]|nr:unnamed protein product [Closterium sp. NIES-65]
MCHATRSRIHTLTPSLHSLSTPSPPSIPSPFPRILTPSPPPPLPPSPTLLAAAPRLICTKVSPVDVARNAVKGCRQWMWRAMQWREDARSHPFPPRSPPLATFSLICTKVSPVDVARNAVDDARSACMRTYGSAPEVEIYGDPDFTFASDIPSIPPLPPLHPISSRLTHLHPFAPHCTAVMCQFICTRWYSSSARSPCMPCRSDIPSIPPIPSSPFSTICNPLHRSYVPTHLHQMVFELCKNSLRAVQERFADADTDPPPIRVVVADGIEDVTIKSTSRHACLLPPSHQHALFPLCCAPSSFPRCCAASLYLQISDEGGGIPHSGPPHIRTYLYSTARLPAATSHSPPCHLPPCDVCPPHPTHPFQISDEGGGIPRSGLPRIWTYLYSTARSPAAAGALQDTPSIMCVPVVGWLGGGSGEMLMCGGLCTIAVPSAESPSTSDDPLGAERQYRGVRQRRWGRWVSEIREPRRGLRIWLGSHSSAEQAARVYDVAVRLLRGDGAILNFPDDQREVLLPPAIAETLIHACAALSSKDSLPDADSTAPLRPLLSSAHTRVAPSSSDSLPRGATAEPCAALAAPGSLAEEGVSLTAAAALMGTGTGDSAGSGGEDEQRGEVEGESVEEMVEEQQEKLQQQEQEVWGDELETLLACEQQIRQQVAQEQAEGEQVEEEQAGEEQAEGEQAEGEQAEGEQAEGEQAEGEQGEGEQAEGEQAKEEQVVEEQAEGEQQGGEQEWQVDWLLACEQLPLDEFTVCDSEPEGALLARAPLAAHTLCGDSGTTVSEAVVGVGEESGRGGAAMGVKGHPNSRGNSSSIYSGEMTPTLTVQAMAHLISPLPLLHLPLPPLNSPSPLPSPALARSLLLHFSTAIACRRAPAPPAPLSLPLHALLSPS